ncbi:MAG: tRNA (adenosine(37)-N6)-threonylcarbamoyltransferase complex dimerization subunit type 1 TsaB [Acidimicrobiia bacterium]|nr:tRNA (adenosine(37)-N6)-threonylcarbamoyltransferase complex dimerization subunit type 1 TsaB [Acidimicrobiia bacterium]
MLLLCLDTATPRVSVALGSNDRVLGEVQLARGQRHAEQLAPAIRYLCDELDVDLAHLAGVGVGLGPGLFTGLRVGVTTARTLAQALRVPVVGVPSLDLVAYPLRHTNRLVAVALDARRHELFYALYRPVPGGVQRVSDYEVGSPEDLAAELAARGEETLLAGDGSLRYWELLRDGRLEQAGPSFASPSAAALVHLATARFEREEFSPPQEVRPLYLRRSDAEIEWDRRAAS